MAEACTRRRLTTRVKGRERIDNLVQKRTSFGKMIPLLLSMAETWLAVAIKRKLTEAKHQPRLGTDRLLRQATKQMTYFVGKIHTYS